MNNSDIQQGQEWLEELLKLGAVPSQVKPSLEADSCWLTIDQVNLTPEQVATLIGQDGEVLDAIQYLLNAIHNLGRLISGAVISIPAISKPIIWAARSAIQIFSG